MSEFKTLNGYPVKDEVARQNLSDYKLENGNKIRELDEKISKEILDRKDETDKTLKEAKRLSDYPKLDDEQKTKIKELIELWKTHKTSFVYDYNDDRDNHASNSCYDSSKGKFKLCCSSFVQLVMMGRTPLDYVGKDGDYSPVITKAHDFGYYFQFKDREVGYGLCKKDSSGAITGYYGYTQPYDGKDEGSYSINTYYNANEMNNPNHQTFNTFQNANDMAKELYELGCEIPYEELDVGDIVFTTSPVLDLETNSMFNDVAWRNITHVAIVEKILDNGELVFIDSNSGGSSAILRCARKGFYDNADTMRGVAMTRNIVMCARLPIAFGINSNVPQEITVSKRP